MKNYSVFLLLFILPFYISSQQIKDSITIYIENQLELKISVEDYDQLSDTSSKITSHLQKFQTYLSGIADDLKPETADLIFYYPDSSISIEKGEKKNIFLIEEGQLRNTGTRDKAFLKLGDAEISLKTRDLSAIQGIDLVDCYKKMILLLPEKSRYARGLYYQCIEGKVTTIEEKNKINYPSGGDVLELNAGVGVSLVKNQLVGDFTFKLGLGFSRKGVYRSNPYASVNLMYDFSDGNKMHINTFLNLGHNWDLKKSKNSTSYSLIGLELGYLISKNGELFEENTFRFGINYALPSGFKLSPQLYIGGGFKRFYPGIRMGFSF